jgi:hypothetical protein
MTRLATLALALASAAGCVFYEDDREVVVDPGPPVVVVPTNSAPWIDDAAAGCFYDGGYRDDIWYFEAVVDDPDGVYDVVSVWADVYDDRSGELVYSYELFPTDDPFLWYSDWLASTTPTNCWYGLYSVDFIAYDSYDAWAALTVLPYTY